MLIHTHSHKQKNTNTHKQTHTQTQQGRQANNINIINVTLVPSRIKREIKGEIQFVGEVERVRRRSVAGPERERERDQEDQDHEAFTRELHSDTRPTRYITRDPETSSSLGHQLLSGG